MKHLSYVSYCTLGFLCYSNFTYTLTNTELCYEERGFRKAQVVKTDILGLSGGSVVKNLPANAGDMNSIPGPRGSEEQPSPCATATEPVPSAWELQLQNSCVKTTEAPCREPRACALQQEKPLQ